MNYKLSTTTTSNNDSDQIQNDIVNYDGELLLNNNNNNRYKSVIDALVWPIVIRPLLYKIQKYNQNAAIILLHSLANAEHCQPGFLQQFCQMILSMNNIDSINMIESLLRLQANIPEADGKFFF